MIKNADQRAMPFMGRSLFSSSRGTLDSDPVIRAAADKALLETTEVTPEYVMAGKLAAGETGESLNADDLQRLYFNARGLVRAGDTSEVEALAKQMVKEGIAKDIKTATKNLADSMQDTHIRIHSGDTGEIIAGKVGFLRLADRYTPQALETKIAKNPFKPNDRLDYRTKLDPEQAELRWIGALKSELPFRENYIFGSHDFPALMKAQRDGLEQIKIDVGNGQTRTISKQELPEYIQLAKGEAIYAHRSGRNSNSASNTP